jgi:hypothetical protein
MENIALSKRRTTATIAFFFPVRRDNTSKMAFQRCVR